MLLREVSECGMTSKRRRSCNDKIKSLVQHYYCSYFEITTEDSICYAVASSGAAV